MNRVIIAFIVDVNFIDEIARQGVNTPQPAHTNLNDCLFRCQPIMREAVGKTLTERAKNFPYTPKEYRQRMCKKGYKVEIIKRVVRENLFDGTAQHKAFLIQHKSTQYEMHCTPKERFKRPLPFFRASMPHKHALMIRTRLAVRVKRKLCHFLSSPASGLAKLMLSSFLKASKSLLEKSGAEKDPPKLKGREKSRNAVTSTELSP